MQSAPDNPPTNQLRAGVTYKALQDAVHKSGYPLQTIIGDNLRSEFGVVDEWSFIDRDSEELRAIDLFAQKELFDPSFLDHSPRIRPKISLLIECKKSELPYVFFLSQSSPWHREFPVVCGLKSTEIPVITNDDPSSWEIPVVHALGLDELEFSRAPHNCRTFSQAERRGKELELSGSNVFNSLVLPLVKALEYYKSIKVPPSSAYYFDAIIGLVVAVIDAPMVGVRTSEEELTMLPWVRLLRLEAVETTNWWETHRLYSIDVVHADFFRDYIRDQVIPFSTIFAARAMEHEEVLASGKAFAPGMGRDHWTELHRRIKPRKPTSRLSGLTSVIRRSKSPEN